MVVEDVPFNVKILKKYLDRLNAYICNISTNGKEAVEAYERIVIQKRQRIDMICMDIEMPVMNGKDAAKKIRKIEQEKGVPQCKIIFVSGNTFKSEMDECLRQDGEIRGKEFLRKPLSFDEFAGTYMKIYREYERIGEIQ